MTCLASPRHPIQHLQTLDQTVKTIGRDLQAIDFRVPKLQDPSVRSSTERGADSRRPSARMRNPERRSAIPGSRTRRYQSRFPVGSGKERRFVEAPTRVRQGSATIRRRAGEIAGRPSARARNAHHSRASVERPAVLVPRRTNVHATDVGSRYRDSVCRGGGKKASRSPLEGEPSRSARTERRTTCRRLFPSATGDRSVAGSARARLRRPRSRAAARVRAVLLLGSIRSCDLCVW